MKEWGRDAFFSLSPNSYKQVVGGSVGLGQVCIVLELGDAKDKKRGGGKYFVIWKCHSSRPSQKREKERKGW